MDESQVINAFEKEAVTKKLHQITSYKFFSKVLVNSQKGKIVS